MTAVITWLTGAAGPWIAGLLVAVFGGLGLYAKGRADATAKHRAQADRAALDTIGRIEDAQDRAAAGGGAWHERLRQSGK